MGIPSFRDLLVAGPGDTLPLPRERILDDRPARRWFSGRGFAECDTPIDRAVGGGGAGGTDLGVSSEDVEAVAGAEHPAGHHLVDRPLSRRDVLAGGAVAVSL